MQNDLEKTKDEFYDIQWEFDHSFGACCFGGFFCWQNRYGSMTFVHSGEDGGIDVTIICDGDNARVVTPTTVDEGVSFADQEHRKDDMPSFRTPTFQEMETLVLIFAIQRFHGDRKKDDSVQKLIDTYLTPGARITSEQREYLMSKRLFLPSEFKRYAREMPYPNFLRTPYWRAVSEAVKESRGCCQLCGSITKLEVHHSDYSIHGDEINHTDSLTVLCHKCHSKFHDKEK